MGCGVSKPLDNGRPLFAVQAKETLVRDGGLGSWPGSQFSFPGTELRVGHLGCGMGLIPPVQRSKCHLNHVAQPEAESQPTVCEAVH